MATARRRFKVVIGLARALAASLEKVSTQRSPRTARDAELDENEVGERILGCAIQVHRNLGPGLLESVYETCLAHELSKAGIVYRRQLTLPVVYDGVEIEAGYRLDLLVEDLVVVEVKSVETLLEVHRAQLLSCLRLGQYRLGYVLNFNTPLLKDGIVRLVNRL